MDPIRLATAAEINEIADVSDLGPSSTVWKMGEDTAVVRSVFELDPVLFGKSSSTQRRLLFVWGLENMLRGNGVPFYYFNVPPGDEQWRHCVETFGAGEVSKEPELRYKKLLIKP